MTYAYSAANRLDEPHHYMYAPYQGAALLAEYSAARREAIERATRAGGARVPPWLGDAKNVISGERPAPAAPVTSLQTFSVDAVADTAALLESVIAAQISGVDVSLVKQWLDRLTQRFEVTKKLFETYPPGFRKGEGSHRSVRAYWLFAVALALACSRGDNLKFLSTLLKVNDLLCSLPPDDLGEMPEGGLAFVVGAEREAVARVAGRQGVALAAR